MRFSFDTLHLGRCTGRAVTACVGTALLLGALACGENPYEIQWAAQPDTVLLYSLARDDLNLPSAFDFHNRRRVIVEAPGSTGSWDVALDTQGGQLVFVLPGTFGIESRARITSLTGLTFQEVREAPSDTAAYRAAAPVPIEEGTIYVVQTDSRPGRFRRTCVYYAKLEPLAADAEAGTLRFVFDASPVCNDRRLVPPDDD